MQIGRGEHTYEWRSMHGHGSPIRQRTDPCGRRRGGWPRLCVPPGSSCDARSVTGRHITGHIGRPVSWLARYEPGGIGRDRVSVADGPVLGRSGEDHPGQAHDHDHRASRSARLSGGQVLAYLGRAVRSPFWRQTTTCGSPTGMGSRTYTATTKRAAMCKASMAPKAAWRGSGAHTESGSTRARRTRSSASPTVATDVSRSTISRGSTSVRSATTMR